MSTSADKSSRDRRKPELSVLLLNITEVAHVTRLAIYLSFSSLSFRGIR